MTLVEAVLGRVAPAAAPDVDPATHAELVLEQLLRDGDVDRRRPSLAVADEHPDHAESLGVGKVSTETLPQIGESGPSVMTARS